MLTESLLVACIHLPSSAARFRVEKRAILTREFPLLFSPLLPSFSFHPLPPLPKSLFTSSSLFSPHSPSSASSQHPLTTSPSSPHHTHLCLPLLISSPRVRDQSGEGLAVGVMRGWSWEPGRVRSALSPRGERGREITRSSLARQSTPLPSACVHAFAWAAPIETYEGTLTEKAHKSHLHTDTNLFFFFFYPTQKSQINAGTNRLCQSWQHRQ